MTQITQQPGHRSQVRMLRRAGMETEQLRRSWKGRKSVLSRRWPNLFDSWTNDMIGLVGLGATFFVSYRTNQGWRLAAWTAWENLRESCLTDKMTAISKRRDSASDLRVDSWKHPDRYVQKCTGNVKHSAANHTPRSRRHCLDDLS